jgi:hypothetical protein
MINSGSSLQTRTERKRDDMTPITIVEYFWVAPLTIALFALRGRVTHGCMRRRIACTGTNGGNEMVTKNKPTAMSACRLKDQDFPIEVRFSGGWKLVHYVSDDVMRGESIVILWDRDGREIAKVYPSTELMVRVD